MKKIAHYCAGLEQWNGMAAVARMLVDEQKRMGNCASLTDRVADIGKNLDEVWVHGMWLPGEWVVCACVLAIGKRLVRMTHGSLSPLYLKHQSPFKKWLVGPIERFYLRRCSKIVATCDDEKEWIAKYLGKRCPPIEITNIKRFFDLGRKEHKERKEGEPLHLLYLGRHHPLKGLEYLDEALRKIQKNGISFNFRAVGNALGEEKERVWNWCDVLVLPTLSENFGLVTAEALERGKRVITTDGAPAWGDGNTYGGRLIYIRGYREGSRKKRIALLESAIRRFMSEMGCVCTSG